MKKTQKNSSNSFFKTRQQIANEYQIDRKTLYNLLKEHKIEIPSRKLLGKKEQNIIYAVLGKPECIETD